VAKANVRKNDTVVVISGKDRGKRGRVLQVYPKVAKALVEGINIVKRHSKPNPQRNVKGGILAKEAPVQLSNVMVIDPDTDKATRVGRKILEDGTHVRVARRSGAVLDR
jgi:large subunit ribosomal protein L24